MLATPGFPCVTSPRLLAVGIPQREFLHPCECRLKLVRVFWAHKQDNNRQRGESNINNVKYWG